MPDHKQESQYIHQGDVGLADLSLYAGYIRTLLNQVKSKQWEIVVSDLDMVHAVSKVQFPQPICHP